SCPRASPRSATARPPTLPPSTPPCARATATRSSSPAATRSPPVARKPARPSSPPRRSARRSASPARSAAASSSARPATPTAPPDLHLAHAARVRRALGPKPLHLVFLSPSCAKSVQEWPLPEGSRVEHVTSSLARALAALPERSRPPPLPETVAWHDPCALARDLSELTAPRALLSAAVKEFCEPPRSGIDT